MPKKTISHGINKEIGEKLRLVRQHQQLSQQNVADDIGVSASAYSKMENGKTEFSATRLSQLAAYYKIHLPDLLDARVTVPRDLKEIGKMVDYDRQAIELDAARTMLRELFNQRK
ncbi:MAG: helix-turn-helix transcriptional regulator [Bacteroidales bacterium]|nr:helix-turn-helix transcriptional regulator [Bacteroidales bacterium]